MRRVERILSDGGNLEQFSVENEPVDLEHLVVWQMWLRLFGNNRGVYAFWLRTQAYGQPVPAVRANDDRSWGVGGAISAGPA